jgi:hypothetical protein
MQIPFASQLKTIHEINDSQLEKYLVEYLAVNEAKEFKTIQDLKRDFNYFVKNSITFQSKTKSTYNKPSEKPKSRNVFDEIYEDLQKQKHLKNE